MKRSSSISGLRFLIFTKMKLGRVSDTCREVLGEDSKDYWLCCIEVFLLN